MSLLRLSTVNVQEMKIDFSPLIRNSMRAKGRSHARVTDNKTPQLHNFNLDRYLCHFPRGHEITEKYHDDPGESACIQQDSFRIFIRKGTLLIFYQAGSENILTITGPEELCFRKCESAIDNGCHILAAE